MAGVAVGGATPATEPGLGRWGWPPNAVEVAARGRQAGRGSEVGRVGGVDRDRRRGVLDERSAVSDRGRDRMFGEERANRILDELDADHLVTARGEEREVLGLSADRNQHAAGETVRPME